MSSSNRAMVFVDITNLLQSPKSGSTHLVRWGPRDYELLLERLSDFIQLKGWKLTDEHPHTHFYVPQSKGAAVPSYKYDLWAVRRVCQKRREELLLHKGALLLVTEPCLAERQEGGSYRACSYIKRETVEKETEVSLAADLVRYACEGQEGAFDHAILISRDTDFLPAVEVVQKVKGKKVLNVFFERSLLSKKCGDGFKDLLEIAPALADKSAKYNAQAIPKIFIVHGRDKSHLMEIENLLLRLGLQSVILGEPPDDVWTLMGNFQKNAAQAAFAIVIATPDDIGGLKGTPVGDLRPRLRQNVILELGYFAAKLGPSRVKVLAPADPLQSEIDWPSDTKGLVYIPLDHSGDWKKVIIRALAHAGIVEKSKVVDVI